MEFRLREEFLITCRLDNRLFQSKGTHGFPQKGRLSRFCLDHGQTDSGRAQPHRDSRRAPAGADIHEICRLGRQLPRCDNRLQQETIDRFVGIIQRSQVDFAVPAIEEFVIGRELRDKIVWEKNAGFPSSLGQSSAKITRRHAMRLAESVACASPAIFDPQPRGVGRCACRPVQPPPGSRQGSSTPVRALQAESASADPPSPWKDRVSQQTRSPEG